MEPKIIPPLDPGLFLLCAPGERPARPRRLDSPAGLGDRLRTAAFAEWQAVAAFGWAAERFTDSPGDLRRDWARQVADEVRHYELLRNRMAELAVDVSARPVSTALWDSLKVCTSGREFCLRIAAAEERGRRAALTIGAFLQERDPETTAIFREIAADEAAHVALAETYYGWTPGRPPDHNPGK